MESWQVNHIRKNLHELIRLTDCNTTTLTFLQSKEILADEDVSRLTDKYDGEGSLAQTKLFYEILTRKRRSYEALIQALHESLQFGSLQILSQGKHEKEQGEFENVGHGIRELQSYTGNDAEDQLGTLTTLTGTDISYIHEKRLGQTATSTVYHGYYGKNPAAVKRINPEHYTLYKTELNNWQDMQKTNEVGNINIVTLHQWSEQTEAGASAFYLAMELAICDLEKKVVGLNNPLFDSERQQLNMFIHDAAKGLHWIHESANFLHRDIKPANILVFENLSGQLISKLGDFGVSRKLSQFALGTSTKAKGTSCWMAPETLMALNNDDEPFRTTRAVDIFPLGMTASFTLSMTSTRSDGVKNTRKILT